MLLHAVEQDHLVVHGQTKKQGENQRGNSRIDRPRSQAKSASLHGQHQDSGGSQGHQGGQAEAKGSLDQGSGRPAQHQQRDDCHCSQHPGQALGGQLGEAVEQWHQSAHPSTGRGRHPSGQCGRHPLRQLAG